MTHSSIPARSVVDAARFRGLSLATKDRWPFYSAALGRIADRMESSPANEEEPRWSS